MSKKNPQKERGNMRKIKQTGEKKESDHNNTSIFSIKNDDMEQAMSM